jgi:predicted Rossmann fold nucleotide-binding protein DprA/Smf involved in DNA uptake
VNRPRSALDDRIATVTACSPLDSSPRSRKRDLALTTQEWNRLAKWLIETERRPADLLFPSIVECLTGSELDQRIVGKACSIPDRASDAYAAMSRMEEEGFWTLCRADSAFPRRWKKLLGSSAPPVIFGAGNQDLLDRKAVSIVGSRAVSPFLADIARILGAQLAQCGRTIVSGAAQGTDLFGMRGALEANGRSVGVLPGNLRRHATQDDLQRHLASDRLCLVSHVHPNTGFLVGNAMARNRLIYAQSDLTIVVSSSEGTGGTWAGAKENINRGIAPIAVWTGEDAPSGNHRLAELGAFPLQSVPCGQRECQELMRIASSHFQSLRT